MGVSYNLFFIALLSFGKNYNNATNAISMISFILLIGIFPVNMKEKNKDKINKTNILTLIVCYFTGFALLLNFSARIYLPLNSKPIEAVKKQNFNEYKNYEYDESKKDCYLCNESLDKSLSWNWGENNVGIVDLNTFDFLKIEIILYDDQKNILNEKTSSMRISTKKFQNGESVYFHSIDGKGYSEGKIILNENSKLSYDSIASFLCNDCLSDLMNQYYFKDEQWNIALLNFENRTIIPFTESLSGFESGNYNIRCNYDKENKKINLLIWHSLVRYENQYIGSIRESINYTSGKFRSLNTILNSYVQMNLGFSQYTML